MLEEGQLTFEDDPSEQDYRRAVERIRLGEWDAALRDLEAILERGVSVPEIYPLLKGVKFWLNRLPALARIEDGAAAGDYLQKEWERFDAFRDGAGLTAHPDASAFRRAVWRRVADEYVRGFQGSAVADPEVLVKLSRALLEVEEWDNARDTLLYVSRFKVHDGRVLAWLGECFHRLGDEERSLLYFRDAFFHQPQAVPLEQLHAPVIARMVERTSAEGFRGDEILRWIFVYGEIGNELWVKRPLTPEETKRLEKVALDLEVDLEIRRRDRAELEPRLLSHYLYLLGPAAARVADDATARARVSSLLSKIRQLNPRIFEALAGRKKD